MDELWNCLLGICCPPLIGNDKRARAMAKLLMSTGKIEPDKATEYAPVVLEALEPLLEVLRPFTVFVVKAKNAGDFRP